MKLTKKAQKVVDKNKALKALLCAEFDSNYDTMQRWVRENKEDSKLTTVKAVTIIEKETGLKQDEILI